MSAQRKAWMRVALYALFYVSVLAVTGELHTSSNALRFFGILWLVQAAGELWHGRRRTQSAL